MYTRHAAQAGFWERSRGTLQPGKLADIAVLDRNLDEVLDEDFEQVRVDYTIVDGRIVYSSATAPG
jgi:predicted amidohydrolase YtcJ